MGNVITKSINVHQCINVPKRTPKHIKRTHKINKVYEKIYDGSKVVYVERQIYIPDTRYVNKDVVVITTSSTFDIPDK